MIELRLVDFVGHIIFMIASLLELARNTGIYFVLYSVNNVDKPRQRED
jgi:hypothetical protein